MGEDEDEGFGKNVEEIKGVERMRHEKTVNDEGCLLLRQKNDIWQRAKIKY